MRKQYRCCGRWFLLVLVLSAAAMYISGCTVLSRAGITAVHYGIERTYTDGKPAIGPTVEKDSTKNVDISSQTRLKVKIQDESIGNIKIIRGDGDKLLINEKTSLKGPASKEQLGKILNNTESNVTFSFASVAIDYKVNVPHKGTEKTQRDTETEGQKGTEKRQKDAETEGQKDAQTDKQKDAQADKQKEDSLKPLYRCTVDMELIVPDSFTSIDVDAENASICLSGFEGLSVVDLSTKMGVIRVDRCSVGRINVFVDSGDIWMKDVTGNSICECGRGDIFLSGLKGDAEVRSVSGITVIEKSEGRLDCDISSGTLTVRESKMAEDSFLYASTGVITADLNGMDGTGTYTLKSPAGDIMVDLPENSGWSLTAKSARGHVKNNMEQLSEGLERTPDGVVYGDVNGGGPIVDIYTDRGNITLY